MLSFHAVNVTLKATSTLNVLAYNLKFLDSLIEQKPDLYLEELQAALRNELEIETNTRKKVCLPSPNSLSKSKYPFASSRSQQLNVMSSSELISGGI